MFEPIATAEVAKLQARRQAELIAECPEADRVMALDHRLEGSAMARATVARRLRSDDT